MGNLRAARDRELLDTAAEFRARRQGVTETGELRALRQAQRRAEAATAKAFQPEDFTAWLYRHQQREEAVVDRLAALGAQRKTVTLPGLSKSLVLDQVQGHGKGCGTKPSPVLQSCAAYARPKCIALLPCNLLCNPIRPPKEMLQMATDTERDDDNESDDNREVVPSPQKSKDILEKASREATDDDHTVA